jgi:glycosyltransferase involved in cell wall biosynthesis
MKNGKERNSILLVGNYSNDTGYAWDNIYKLYDKIAFDLHVKACKIFISFGKFNEPLDWEHSEFIEKIFILPPLPQNITELIKWSEVILKHNIRYVYLTDQSGWSLCYGYFRLLGVRKILVHNRVSVEDPNPALPETGMRRIIKSIIARFSFICADRIYAVSDFVRNRLIFKACFLEDRVITILNGVNLDNFYLKPIKTNCVGVIKIFCGGRASVHKGIQILIQAVAIIRDKYGFNRFVVIYAGDGPDVDSFVFSVNSLFLNENFIFIGKVSSTKKYIADADIIVVPSIWGDACPSAVSEALAAGKPLVATRVGGVPEIVGEDAALLVDPGDALALADAIFCLILDKSKRSELAKRARRRAEVALDECRYHKEVVDQILRDIGMDRVNYGQ